MSAHGGGNATMAAGLFEGINNAVAIMRDDKSRREKDDRENTLYQQKQTAYEQGQEDRGYALERQAVNDERTDAKYTREDDQRAREEQTKKAINGLFVRNDPTEINALLGQYSQSGAKIAIRDGQYFMEGIDPKTGKMVSNPVDKKAIFMGAQRLAQSGKQALEGMKQDFAAQDAKVALKGERDHGMAKIDRQNQGRRDVALINAAAKRGGAGRLSKDLKDAENFFAKNAKSYYGKSFEGMFSFEEGKNKLFTSAASIATSIYQNNDGMNKTEALRLSGNAVDELSKLAKATARKEAEAGTLGGDRGAESDRAGEIFESLVNQSIKKMSSSSEPAVSRKEPPNGGDDFFKLMKKKYPDRPVSVLAEKTKSRFPGWSNKAVEKPKEKAIVRADESKPKERKKSRSERQRDSRKASILKSIADDKEQEERIKNRKNTGQASRNKRKKSKDKDSSVISLARQAGYRRRKKKKKDIKSDLAGVN